MFSTHVAFISRAGMSRHVKARLVALPATCFEKPRKLRSTRQKATMLEFSQRLFFSIKKAVPVESSATWVYEALEIDETAVRRQIKSGFAIWQATEVALCMSVRELQIEMGNKAKQWP
jgi:hypothetical protein